MKNLLERTKNFVSTHRGFVLSALLVRDAACHFTTTPPTHRSLTPRSEMLPLILSIGVMSLWDLSLKSSSDDLLPASDSALVKEIIAQDPGWVAAVPEGGASMSRATLRRMCGTLFNTISSGAT